MAFAIGRRRAWLLGVPLLLLALAAAVTALRPTPASAAPYLPKADEEILETLPGLAANTWLRSATETAPSAAADAATAVARARVELGHYQESADPRYLGRAEAALGSFWDAPTPPEPVLVLRARIRQSNHEFLAALSDLDHALVLSPNDGQALLDRASIQTVLGRYDAGRRDCDALAGLVAPLYLAVCRTAIAGVTGSAKAAASDLSRALLARGVEIEDKCWAESLLGELSIRVGDSAAADAHFRGVLAACPSDSYAQGALADLWLDLQRNAEVVSLLSAQVRQDALLLRLTIAERQLSSPAFKGHFEDLQQRFEEARLRGSSVHRREEARFELVLHDAPERALTLALENFQVQRESADVRIALEAALAAGHPQRAREVVSFARESRLEDPHVRALLARFSE
jgi:tetratricopeptide (TPR) repeat protein